MGKAKERTDQEKQSTKIDVNGVTLTVVRVGDSITVRKVTARDRKRNIDLTSGVTSSTKDFIAFVDTLKRVANLKVAPCTCGYSYGWSDHAESCQSIHVAQEYRDEDD